MEFDKLAKARTRIMMTQPFFSGLVRSMPFEEVAWCPTAATDGIKIYYNKEWCERLSVAELAAVLVHEVLHVIWLHPLRVGHRDPTIWNMACDYVINPVIAALPKSDYKLPEGGLLDPKYENMSAYEVYNELMKNVKQINISFPSPGDGEGQGDGQGDGKGEGQQKMWGGVISPQDAQGNALSPDKIKEIESEISIAVENAVNMAKAIGKMPAGLEGLLEARSKPKVNWQEYIQNWIQGTNPDDYTWSRSNRTMMANYGIFMPRVRSMGSGHGVLSIDTSGSVSDDELRSFIAEIMGVIELTRPDRLTIIQHDSQVQRVDEWAGEPFDKLHIKGRGGTCVAPSFKYVEEMDEPIDWFIGFSDMEINDYPKEAPEYPVLWCASGKGVAPFGTTIHLRDRYE